MDYSTIYDDAYYDGRGADPLVDYRFELLHPDRSIRQYEWRGVARVVSELIGGLDGVRWLDFGCGNGSLVRYLRARHKVDACGFDEGAIVHEARSLGIPILGGVDIQLQSGSYDVVSAIEVLEHTYDPLAELRRMRALLKPGGLLFVTTGNARTHAHALRQWNYVIPEIHISFFEPRTLEVAMTLAGFQTEGRPRSRGLNEILTFKVLKNLRVKRRSALTDAIPRRLVGNLAERAAHMSEHPFGWAA